MDNAGPILIVRIAKAFDRMQSINKWQMLCEDAEERKRQHRKNN